MIGIDTNVLVRYLVQDDKKQSAQATRFIEKALSPQQPGHVCLAALIELVWVLESRYQVNRQELTFLLATLASDPRFHIQDEPALWLALEVCEHSTLDLPDAMIHFVNRHHGCNRTVTFDRRATRLDGVELLD